MSRKAVPIPKLSAGLRGWPRAKAIAVRVGLVLAEEAPTILLLRRDSSPFARAVVVGRTLKRLRDCMQVDKVNHWTTNEWHVQVAIIGAALALEVGERCSADEQVPTRTVDGCIYGGDKSSIVTPYGGSIDSFLGELWRKAGGCLLASLDRDSYTLAPTASVPLPPSARAEEIAGDCWRLHDSGHRVGLLLDGPPGTGKSEVLRYVAAQLGRRVLRASLSKNSRSVVAVFVRHLRPDVVILDDIDRMETEHALEAVDQILAEGVAVLASSNDASKVCDALLRSGRIDLHHRFEGCDPDLFKRLVLGFDAEEVELLRGQTVATIVRFGELRAVLGAEKARAYVEGLAP